jgi:hypothetical protein
MNGFIINLSVQLMNELTKGREKGSMEEKRERPAIK